MRVRLQSGAVVVIQWLAVWLCLQAGARAAVHPATDALFSGQFVPRLEIEVDEKGMEILRANSSNRYNAPNRPDALATVREGTNLYQRVAIHLKGSAGSFRGPDDKPAFTLHFDGNVPAQRFHGLEKISLNNSVQDSTYLCEVLGRQMFNGTAVPVARAGHATVTFNGQSLGLFVLIEGWNKQFLKRHFADTKGNFYEGAFRDDITAQLEAKSGAEPENRSDLDALVRASREPDLERRFAALERVLDVDRFATFLALEVMLMHWDGYSLHVNNYRLFHDNRSGQLIFMPHGMDQLFGVRRREFDPQILPAMSGLVARGFMETRAGRRLYLDRLAQLHTDVFDLPALLAQVDRLTALLRPMLQADGGALAEFNARVPVLRERLEDRHAEVREQLAEMRTPAFNSKGAASLPAGHFKSAARETFSRRRGRFAQEFDGAGLARAYGAWRAVVLLEGGRYRFQARVQTRVNQRAVETEAVSLRSSEGRVLQRKEAGPDWRVLEHEFTLKERDYVDLIYEFTGADGSAALDRSSLMLIRSAQGKDDQNVSIAPR